MILALDQGTHASRALLLDAGGRVFSSHQRGVKLHRPQPGYVEQQADELLNSLRGAMAEAMEYARRHTLHVERAGLATQRSTVVAWSRSTGRPLAPALSWLDTRADLRAFAQRAPNIEHRTGLRLSPHYGAGKLRWLLAHDAGVRQAAKSGDLALGPLASFLLFNLVGGRPFVADHANAHRTLLMNLETCDWDRSLCRLFGLEIRTLPGCVPVCHDFGALEGSDISLTACGGDQGAAMHAYGTPDDAITVNVGTGAFVLAPTGARIIRRPPLLSSLVHSDSTGATYCLEGTVNGAGAAITYAHQQLGCDIAAWAHWEEVAAPPLFVNTVGGLGSPWWRPGPAPALAISAKTSPLAVGAAVMESIVFLIQANLELLSAVGKYEPLRITGGLARDHALCQRLADLSGRTVIRPPDVEATARGIAWLAAGGAGDWSPSAATRFQPARNRSLLGRYRRFRELVDQA